MKMCNVFFVDATVQLKLKNYLSMSNVAALTHYAFGLQIAIVSLSEFTCYFGHGAYIHENEVFLAK